MVNLESSVKANIAVKLIFNKETKIKTIPDTKTLKELFEYDENSPSALRWKVDRFSGYGKLQTPAGSIVGSLNGSGYWQTTIDGDMFAVHRLIYQMFFGSIPEDLIIDHINGIRSDNRIENLRTIPFSLNARNQKKRKTNTTGHTGVTILTTVSKNGCINKYAVAHVMLENSKRKSKCFPIKEHGYEIAVNLAVQWREDMLESLNLVGAGYTERHGKYES